MTVSFRTLRDISLLQRERHCVELHDNFEDDGEDPILSSKIALPLSELCHRFADTADFQRFPGFPGKEKRIVIQRCMDEFATN